MSKNTKHMQLEKTIIDHKKAWATSLSRIKGWARRQIVDRENRGERYFSIKYYEEEMKNANF